MQELFDEYLKKKNTKKSEESRQIDPTCLKWTPHIKRWNRPRAVSSDWWF